MSLLMLPEKNSGSLLWGSKDFGHILMHYWVFTRGTDSFGVLNLPPNTSMLPTMTMRMFQMKNSGLLEALQAAEKTGCLFLVTLKTSSLVRVHVWMNLCSFHSCSSTKDWTLRAHLSRGSSANSTSVSSLSVVKETVRSLKYT